MQATDTSAFKSISPGSNSLSCDRTRTSQIYVYSLERTVTNSGHERAFVSTREFSHNLPQFLQSWHPLFYTARNFLFFSAVRQVKVGSAHHRFWSSQKENFSQNPEQFSSRQPKNYHLSEFICHFSSDWWSLRIQTSFRFPFKGRIIVSGSTEISRNKDSINQTLSGMSDKKSHLTSFPDCCTLRKKHWSTWSSG